MLAGNGSRALAAIMFMGGVEIADNGYGSVCSSPQTTMFRVAEKEGDAAIPERDVMKWVWVANAKCLILTALGSIIAKSPWPILGGLSSVLFMHGCYIHARNHGRQIKGRPSSYVANAVTQKVQSGIKRSRSR